MEFYFCKDGAICLLLAYVRPEYLFPTTKIFSPKFSLLYIYDTFILNALHEVVHLSSEDIIMYLHCIFCWRNYRKRATLVSIKGSFNPENSFATDRVNAVVQSLHWLFACGMVLWMAFVCCKINKYHHSLIKSSFIITGCYILVCCVSCNIFLKMFMQAPAMHRKTSAMHRKTSAMRRKTSAMRLWISKNIKTSGNASAMHRRCIGDASARSAMRRE